jgi:hypothetical protein
MAFYKKYFQRFHELPDIVPANYFRSWVFLNYASLIGIIFHFLWIFMFALVGVKTLSLFNIASTIIWVFAFYFGLKGHMRTALALANIEVVLHAWLATIIIGWDTGFHYYILLTPMIYFLSPWSIVSKIVFTAINCAMYILLCLYSNTHTPVNSITEILQPLGFYWEFFHFITALL